MMHDSLDPRSETAQPSTDVRRPTHVEPQAADREVPLAASEMPHSVHAWLDGDPSRNRRSQVRSARCSFGPRSARKRVVVVGWLRRRTCRFGFWRSSRTTEFFRLVCCRPASLWRPAFFFTTEARRAQRTRRIVPRL